MSGSIHELDGAYVLGALSPEDRRRYEAHLEECPACAGAVGELAGLPGILGVLDDDAAVALRDLPDDAALRGRAHAPDRAAGIARRVRRHRRRTRLLIGAALVAAVAIGPLGWSLVTGQEPAAQSASAHEMTPVGDSHLSADLRVTSVGWGTRLEWSCDYRAPAGEQEEDEPSTPVSYSLVVRTDSGASVTVATWSSDEGEAKGLVAATAIPADTIRRVEIRVTGSRTALAQTLL